MSMFKKGKKIVFGKKIEDIINTSKKGGGKSDLYFKPELGESTLRILPYIHDETNWPFFETFTHWKINGENLLSPKTYQQKDPFIELASSIWNNENINEVDRKQMFKRLMPQSSTYCPVIVRGEDETAVKLWRVPKGALDSIINLLHDSDTESLIDPYDGLDIVLTKTQSNPQDFKTISYTIRAKRKDSAVGSEADMEKIFNIETFPKYTDIWQLLDEKEYLAKFNKFIDGNSDFNNSNTNTKEQKPVIVVTTAEKPEVTASNTDVNDTLNKFKKMVGN